MAVMNTAEAWPTGGQPFTVDDLDRFPDDGRRYELIDGVLIVSPAPILAHQFAMMELIVLLRGSCPDDLYVLPGPGVMVNVHTELIPDIVVMRRSDLSRRKLTGPPPMVVEIQSPSTRLFDLNQKKSVYEKFGVGSYWIVVPDRDAPELVVFELTDGGYEQVAKVAGEEVFSAERPFPVEVTPARLVAGLSTG